ncbi:TRAP transporter small permease [Testudinibacter sp. TR-2022]|uniref:TRAP transporter small permease n=1 Tax=Testudinibacter sp. TR-2022 TaxID=2585029 RepID=UPI001119D6EA|nr:TRAP transporter small permease [Testudinibacter sp. TR-2022]TNH08466.1 TRAP transporter small permease [Pasteurellaceae bacterium Phil11]TNH26036.1 TRAP transporter small permease [Testudinibacter sp. TR-2022]TNH28285.1 TRAP transporter small permease [Testudinibacter sp. TR-2022]
MQIEKIKKPIDLFISSFSIVVMALLVICVSWQVFSRYVLQTPSTVTDEIARFSMIWVGLLGAAYTVGVQRHLSIDLFTHNLSGKKKQLSNIVINIFIFLFALSVMVYGGGTLVSKVYASGQISPSMQLPMAYVYIALPLSGILMMFYSLLFTCDNITKLNSTKGEK